MGKQSTIASPQLPGSWRNLISHNAETPQSSALPHITNWTTVNLRDDGFSKIFNHPEQDEQRKAITSPTPHPLHPHQLRFLGTFFKTNTKAKLLVPKDHTPASDEVSTLELNHDSCASSPQPSLLHQSLWVDPSLYTTQTHIQKYTDQSLGLLLSGWAIANPLIQQRNPGILRLQTTPGDTWRMYWTTRLT